MTSTVSYEGGLRTTCTHLKSGSYFETDAPTDNNGKGERFSPTDLLATSLGTCMLTVMGIKARSLGFDLDGLQVEVLKHMKADPRRISAIDLVMHIPENLVHLNREHVETLRYIADNCPVMKSIHPDIVVTTDWGAWQS